MKNLRRLFKAGLILCTTGCIVFAACGNKQNFKTSDKLSLLWEISGNNLAEPSFLYGTIHLYDTTVYKLPKEVFKAIDLCDNFALEVDMNNINPMVVAQRTLVQHEDSTLNILLGQELFDEISKIPFLKMMGERFKYMKPLFISVFLLSDNPAAMLPVESVLNKYSLDANKNIFGIETIEEQLDAVDKIPLSEQAKSIVEMYEYCKKENKGFTEVGKQVFKQLSTAYMNQDFEIAQSLEKEFAMTSSSPNFDEFLLKSRNINMADRISDFIKDGKTLFVGLGMLHLTDQKAGKGVVTLLKDKGYTLRPILIDLRK